VFYGVGCTPWGQSGVRLSGSFLLDRMGIGVLHGDLRASKPLVGGSNPSGRITGERIRPGRRRRR